MTSASKNNGVLPGIVILVRACWVVMGSWAALQGRVSWDPCVMTVLVVALGSPVLGVDLLLWERKPTSLHHCSIIAPQLLSSFLHLSTSISTSTSTSTSPYPY
jgi:hypothetical protein